MHTETRTVTLSLQIAKTRTEHGFRIDVDLRRDEAIAMNGLRESLQARVARLRDGRLIQSNADVVRWLAQQMGAPEHPEHSEQSDARTRRR
ncbi:MAG: hypothetical protein KF847_19650 [Pirellulales bacterium]|nr:hypothetical protein [Pirellulales bacterium]